jgi:hypothetical protein
MTESPWYGAGVGIASADPANIVVKAAIEAQQATRIKALQLKLFVSKNAGFSTLFPDQPGPEARRDFMNFQVYKIFIATRRDECKAEARQRDAYCAATPTLMSR